MFSWLSINILLTVFVAIYLALTKCAPSRISFLVCFLMLITWLLPWSLLVDIIPPLGWGESTIGKIIPTGHLALSIPLYSPQKISLESWLFKTLILLSSVGIIKFAFILKSHDSFLSMLNISGKEVSAELVSAINLGKIGSIPIVRSQKMVAGAFYTGFRYPTIWIHESLLNDKNIFMILFHELIHIKNNDNKYLWIMTFITSIYWWNPLVLWIESKARRLQELSCDEACSKAYPDYRNSLNDLIIKLSRTAEVETQEKQPLCAGMLHCKNFNVERVRLLKRSPIMKTRYYFASFLLALCSLGTVGLVTAQTQELTHIGRAHV